MVETVEAARLVGGLSATSARHEEDASLLRLPSPPEVGPSEGHLLLGLEIAPVVPRLEPVLLAIGEQLPDLHRFEALVVDQDPRLVALLHANPKGVFALLPLREN